MARGKQVHVVELTVTQTFVTEMKGCDSPEEALNRALADHCLAIPFFSDRPTKDPGELVVNKAAVYDHPAQLMKQCGGSCLKFLTEEHRAHLHQLVADQEHNMAQIGVWLIENDPEWMIVEGK
ncbi:hypothetical protein LCGC14_2863450 [marine sediment metagenome]|uniref:Uncharacterized protein n=1 Tax=marine sediment metagenome TaxID=412755 RepID=A0A0F8Y5B3_9ZZZZ